MFAGDDRQKNPTTELGEDERRTRIAVWLDASEDGKKDRT